MGSGWSGTSNQGRSCSLSNDGNTLAVGALGDNNFIGATWIFNRSGSIWSQNIKLVGTDGIGATFQGISCALSGDGTMLAVGGDGDSTSNGATWIFVQSGDVWTQQSKIVGKGNIGSARQGTACSLSNNGSILAVGGDSDNSDVGASWVFKRSGSNWIQQDKLVGSGYIGESGQGVSCALNSSGNILAVGGPDNNGSEGATWIFGYV